MEESPFLSALLHAFTGIGARHSSVGIGRASRISALVEASKPSSKVSKGTPAAIAPNVRSPYVELEMLRSLLVRTPAQRP